MMTRRHISILIALLLIAVAMSAAAYPRLPAQVAIHWNWRGDADGFGPRWLLALMVPASASLIVALLSVLPMIGPMRREFPRWRSAYGRICVAVVAALTLCHAALLSSALGRPVDVPMVMLLILGVMLAVIGNLLGKVRRNFWVGIRTPWTLASDAVWERTHRIGARLTVAHGLALAAAALLLPTWAGLSVLLGGTIMLVVWSLVYSCWLYRRMGEVDDLA
jgi:uncharacterized membrane protein